MKPSIINNGYLGKNNVYNLIPHDPYFAVMGENFIVSISNIVVTQNNEKTNNYLFVVGNAGSTSLGEEWSIKTNGQAFEVMDEYINKVPMNSQEITGVGSNKVNIKVSGFNTVTYIFQSFSPKEISVICKSTSTSQISCAFGVVIKIPKIITKKEEPHEIENKVGNYVKFKYLFTPTDKNIIDYIIENSITPNRGLTYISSDSVLIPRSSIKQVGKVLNIEREILSESNVKLYIDSDELKLDLPVDIELIYKLNEVLESENIYNKITITPRANMKIFPTFYGDAKTTLIKREYPSIEMSIESNEILIKAGELVKFKIIASELQVVGLVKRYIFIHKLDPHLEFDKMSSSLTVKVGSKIVDIPLDVSVDFANVLTINVDAEYVPTDGILTLDIAAYIKNELSIVSMYKSLNRVTFIAESDVITECESNEVTVLFVNQFYKSVSNVIKSIALQQDALSHILNAEGEKVQKLMKIGKFSNEDINNVNKSINSVVDSITLLEVVLSKKISIVQNGCTLNNCTNSK